MKDRETRVLEVDGEKVQYRPLNWVIKHYWWSYAILLSIIIAFTIAFVGLTFADQTIDLDATGGDPLEIRDEPSTEREYAFRNANDDRVRESTFLESNRSTQAYPISVYFDVGRDDNVFTLERIQQMRAFEQELIGKEQWASDFCWQEVGEQSRCRPLISVLNYFYPEVLPGNVLVYNGRGQSIVRPIEDTLADMASGEGQFSESSSFVDTLFSPTRLSSSITRIVFYAGTPLEGFSSSADDQEGQNDKITDFYVDEWNDLLEDADISGGDVYYIGAGVSREEILSILYRDLLLSIPSLLFVCFLLFCQSKSVWVALNGGLMVATSFPIALFIYSVVLRFREFSFFHILGLYIMLGIGFDDIYIQLDTWGNALFVKFTRTNGEEITQDEPDFLKARLSWTWKESAKAMAVTTITTFFAFVSLIALPFPTLSAFGVFCGLLSITNYILVITFFPVVLLVEYCVFSKWHWCCCRNSEMWKVDPAKIVDIEQAMDNPTSQGFAASIVYRFYTRPLLSTRLRAGIVIAVMCSLGIACVVLAAFTSPTDEPFQLLPDDYNFQLAQDSRDKFASATDANVITVKMVWGIHGVDFDDADDLDQWDTGKNEYFDNTVFDLSSAESQQHLHSICDRLELDNELRSSLYVDTVYCFLKDFDAWVIANDPGAQLPLVGDQFTDLLRNFSRTSPFSEKYKKDIGFFADENIDGDETNDIPYEEIPLRYVSLSIDTFFSRSTSFDEGIEKQDRWEDFVDRTNDEAFESGATMTRAFVTTEVTYWSSFHEQKVLYNSAWEGVGLSISIAFIALTLFTHNIIVSFYAVVTIGLVIAAELAIFFIVGFDIGISESIAIVLAVGLSIDATTHFAHAYVHSPFVDRYSRTMYAVQRVSLAVINGAISSMGASFFLLFTVVLVPQRFGATLFVTIGWSLIFAFFFFLPLLRIVGPTGNWGDLKYACKQLFQRCKSE